MSEGKAERDAGRRTGLAMFLMPRIDLAALITASDLQAMLQAIATDMLADEQASTAMTCCPDRGS